MRPANLWMAALVAAFELVVIAGCGGSTSAPPEPRVFLNHDPAVAYVGRERCRDCHLGHYTTYSKTGMGRSAGPLTAETVAADFTDDNEFADPATGLHYKMTERDGRFYQLQYLPDGDGTDFVVEEREVAMIIGSNNHNRAYVTAVDGKLFQMPVCWYPQASTWDYCPGFEHKNDHFAREISASCVFCHNGRMELVEGARNEFREPIPHGIGCERCHGPGQFHVERWASDETPDGEADPTIVNPRRLDRQERLDVCFQCHLGDAKQTERVGRHQRPQESFRPGQRLTEVLHPFRYVDQTERDFGLSSQADRLMLSACYTEGQIECLTCHNPHISVNHPERPADHFRRKCPSCHVSHDCTAPAGERAGTGAFPDDCVARHMRKAEPDDQRMTEFTDHWIRREIDTEGHDRRSSFEIEPIFPDALETLPAGEQAYYRARARFLMSGDAPPAARDAMRFFAETTFLEAIDAGFDTAAAWFFLGKTRSLRGNHQGAVEAYRVSLERDPEHYDAAFALGQTLGGLGQPDRALAVFERLLAGHPADGMALSEYGRLALALGRAAEALSAYETALTHEPWNPTFQLNYGMSLAAVGRFEEAAHAGTRAVQLDPDGTGAWSLYWNAMRESGRGAEAASGRRQYERLTGSR